MKISITKPMRARVSSLEEGWTFKCPYSNSKTKNNNLNQQEWEREEDQQNPAMALNWESRARCYRQPGNQTTNEDKCDDKEDGTRFS